MKPEDVQDGKIYLLKGATLKALMGKVKAVSGAANQIDVGIDKDGLASLKFAKTIQIEVYDPASGESILLTVPYVNIETPSLPFQFDEFTVCVNGSEADISLMRRPS